MKNFTKLILIPLILIGTTLSCSSDDDTVNDENEVVITETVFERLQGATFRQIETTSSCATCEDEINFYIFTEDALQITGTTLDEICEQNDLIPIGDCTDCATVQEDSIDELTLCLDGLCQTITFLSEDEIQFDFPAANQKWTAQRFNEEPPCKEWEAVGFGPETVLGRLSGKTFRQIETTDSCANCEDEVNYYMFSDQGIRITGTTLDGECEQNDYAAFGDSFEIDINSNDIFRVCTGNIVRACQEITFLSDTEIQFVFNTPVSSNTWTAQLFSEEVPCTQWGFQAFFTEAFGGTNLTNVSYEPFTATYELPSSAQSWGGFANSNGGIYPLMFTDGGNFTFTAATSGTDIDVYIRLERLPYLDSDPDRVEPSYNSSSVTISGTESKEYSVEIEPQGTNTFSSIIFYLQTRDQELVVSSEFDINTY